MLISKLKCLTYIANSKCVVSPRDDSLSMSMKFEITVNKNTKVFKSVSRCYWCSLNAIFTIPM